MTEYRLLRYSFTPLATQGLLMKLTMMDGLDFLAYTLEDAFRPGQPKIPGQTCIPLGRYELKLTHMPVLSAKYGHDMIEITKVPGFSGIAIHVGNYVTDTNGCVLVGTGAGQETISGSKNQYAILYPKIVADIKAGPVFLQVIRA